MTPTEDLLYAEQREVIRLTIALRDATQAVLVRCTRLIARLEEDGYHVNELGELQQAPAEVDRLCALVAAKREHVNRLRRALEREAG